MPPPPLPPSAAPAAPAVEARGQQALRTANRALLLQRLRAGGPASRADLARSTGLSGTTVSSLVAELVAEGTLAETPTDGASSPSSTRGGRPGRLVQLVAGRGLVLGLDLTCEDGVRGALGDLAGSVLAEQRLPATHGRPAGTGHRWDSAGPAATALLDLVTALLAPSSTVPVDAADRLLGVVIAVPGVVDPASGAVVSARDPWWAELDASGAVAKALAALPSGRRDGHTAGTTDGDPPPDAEYRCPPVVLENDADLLTLGEATHGAARGLSDVLCLEASTGIGLGLLLDGRLHRGWRGGAGEIGHVEVDSGGSLCTCGNRGCLETVASADRVLEDLRAVHPEAATPGDLAALVAAGDRAAVRAVTDAGALIGKVVADACNVLAPQAVVVSGSLASGGGVLSAAVRAAVERYTKPRTSGPVLVVDHELGERGVVLGALAAAVAAAQVVP